MPNAHDDSVRSCAERVAGAQRALATGLAPLPARWASAAEVLLVLQVSEFPKDLRVPFAAIYEALTAAGNYAATIQRMTLERAQDVAEQLCDLAAEVARRDAIESS